MHYVKYIHPAATKYEAYKNYLLDDLKLELSMEMIKMLFEPVGFEWSDLDKAKSTYNKEETKITSKDK